MNKEGEMPSVMEIVDQQIIRTREAWLKQIVDLVYKLNPADADADDLVWAYYKNQPITDEITLRERFIAKHGIKMEASFYPVNSHPEYNYYSRLHLVITTPLSQTDEELAPFDIPISQP